MFSALCKKVEDDLASEQIPMIAEVFLDYVNLYLFFFSFIFYIINNKLFQFPKMNIYIKYISAKKLSDHLLYEKMKSSIELSNIINVITSKNIYIIRSCLILNRNRRFK
jgi:hypothetical protein